MCGQPPQQQPKTHTHNNNTNEIYVCIINPHFPTHTTQEKIAKDPSVKAAVLISAKPDNFIAGADIKFIDTVEDFATLKDGGLGDLGMEWSNSIEACL